jgi:hypothetical protein
MPTWNFVSQGLNGGSTGEAFYSTLNNNAFPIPERLAREALQNSRDAKLEDRRLRVDFRFIELTGEEKESFVETLDLPAIAKRRVPLGLPTGTCLDAIDDPSVPLRLLLVSDFGTCGLWGNPYKPGSHLRRLLLTLGDRSKAREDVHSGGSYGFGKAVYSASSRIRTIVAYSRFDEHPDEGVTARLLGCGYFQAFEDSDDMFDGRALFGNPTKIRKEMAFAPFENDKAHQLAASLGLSARTESGTTIAIVDAQVKAADLIRGIETWWWPALVEKSMDVTVHDADGKRHVPRTRRPDLRPYVEAFHIATKMAEPLGKAQQRMSFQRVANTSIGDGAAVLVDEAVLSEVPEDERESRVALIRSPRMVVQYLRIPGAGPIVQGAFVASEEVDQWLKISENPAHDVWDPTSPDLDRFPPEAREVVQVLPGRIKNAVQRFRREAMPKPEVARKSLRVFEAALGRLFKNKSSGVPDSPDKPSNPVHFAFVRQPSVESRDDAGQQIRFVTKFNLSLDAAHTTDSGDIELSIDCDIVEDEGGAGTPLPLFVTIGDQALKEAGASRWGGTIRKGGPICVEVESAPYERDWTVRFNPRVDFVEGAA